MARTFPAGFLAAALAACAAAAAHGPPAPGGGVRVEPLGERRRPMALAAADLDGDGRADLVAAHTCDGALTVFFSRLGTRHHPAPHQPAGVALGDVNGDGRPDVVVANRTGFFLSVYLASKEGLSPRTDHVPMRPGVRNHEWGAGLALADFDGDGRLDVAVGAGPWGGQASMLVLGGDGRGGFRPIGPSPDPGRDPETFITPSMAAGDLDRDGRVDLAIARVGAPPCIRLGRGDGTFGRCEAPSRQGSGDRLRSVAVADLDGDGLLDLVGTDADRDALAVLLGRRGGGLAPRGFLLTNREPGPVVVADVDGDGRPDLLTASLQEGDVAVARADGKGWFHEAVRIPLCTTFGSLNYEHPDPAVRAFARDAKARGELPEPEGKGLAAVVQALEPFRPYLTPTAVAAADFDGDGRVDLAATDARAERVVFRLAGSAPALPARFAGACRSHEPPLPEWRASADRRVCAFKDAHGRVIVRERQRGPDAALNLVAPDPVPRGWTSRPDVSGDGRFVAFISYEGLTPEAAELEARRPRHAERHPSLFVWDRATRRLSLARIDPASGLRPRGMFPNAPRLGFDGGEILYLAKDVGSTAAPRARGPCGLAVLDRLAGREECLVSGPVEDFDASADAHVVAWIGRDYEEVVIAERDGRGREPRILHTIRREIDAPAGAAQDSAERRRRKFYDVAVDEAGTRVLLWSTDPGRPRHWDLFLADVRSGTLAPVPYEAAIAAELSTPRFVLEPDGGAILIADDPALYRYDPSDGKAREVTAGQVLCAAPP